MDGDPSRHPNHELINQFIIYIPGSIKWACGMNAECQKSLGMQVFQEKFPASTVEIFLENLHSQHWILAFYIHTILAYHASMAYAHLILKIFEYFFSNVPP